VGTFVSNLQVFTHGEPAAAREQVRAALSEFAASNGLTETADAAEADRTFVIAWSSATPWLTVYDEAIDSQDVRVIESVAAAVSASSGLKAVSVLLHDGDDLDLRLFTNGKRIDRYRNTHAGESRKRRTGHPSRWAALLRNGSLQQLESLWEAQSLGEQILDSFVSIFGWDPERAWLSYQYLDDLTPGSDARLHFRSAVPAPHRRRIAGLPAFKRPHISTTVGFEFVPGDALEQELFFFLTPSGGFGKGFDVIAFGSALPLMRLEGATISRHDRSQSSATFHETTLLDGQRAMVAPFPFEQIAAAIAPLESPEQNQYVLRWMDAENATKLLLRLNGHAVNEGAGILGIAVRPAENHAGIGYDNAECVVGHPRRPLTSNADRRSLRAIERKFTLLGHVIIPSIDAALSPHIRKAVDQWDQAIATTIPRYAYHGIIEGRKKPRAYGVTPDELTTSSPWNDVMAAPAAVDRYTLAAFERDEDETLIDAVGGREPDQSLGGFVLANRPRFQKDRRTRYAVQLLFWRRIRYLGPEVIDRVEPQLRAIIEELSSSCSAIQAFVARWQLWSPDLTMYERACGLEQVPQLSALEHVKGTLRGVSDVMWLNPEILAIIDLNELSRVADIETMGAVTRIRLRNGAALEDLERALLPLLPRG